LVKIKLRGGAVKVMMTEVLGVNQRETTTTQMKRKRKKNGREATDGWYRKL